MKLVVTRQAAGSSDVQSYDYQSHSHTYHNFSSKAAFVIFMYRRRDQ